MSDLKLTATLFNSLKRHCSSAGIKITKESLMSELNKRKLNTFEDTAASMIIDKVNYHLKRNEFRQVSYCMHSVTCILDKIGHKGLAKAAYLHNRYKIIAGVDDYMSNLDHKIAVTYVPGSPNCDFCSPFDGVDLDAINEILSPSIPFHLNDEDRLCLPTPVIKSYRDDNKERVKWTPQELSKIKTIKKSIKSIQL